MPETEEAATRFNGTPIFIGGNVGGDASAEDSAALHGAADFHRRKFTARTMANYHGIASLGPPIFIGGNAAAPQAWRSAVAIGAADFHRRK